MDPGKNAIYNSAVMLPWGFKIVYGIVFDTFPLCGSRKRAWMIILCCLQIICAGTATIFVFENPAIVAVLLALSGVADAGMDVIVDAIMVMQAKRDPKNGS